jgi:imidazolonepropionase
MNLLGPFAQIVTMRNLPLKGALNDGQLEIISDGGIVTENGKIIAMDKYIVLAQEYSSATKEEIQEHMVAMPGMIDAHTHICFAGDRANDYAMRVSGKTYQDIALSGGGITSTVANTRKASEAELVTSLLNRCDIQLKNGITTCEVKSGYGLNLQDECKMLRAIKKADKMHSISLIPTCLAAHTKPLEFDSKGAYIQFINQSILPKIKNEQLANRVDIFIDEIAFNENEARTLLNEARALGFSITIHADQFSTAGSKLAVEFNAQSADHLEFSNDSEIALLANSDVVGTLLPGACLGLGLPFPKARKMLDKGMCIAIASDWNPGSAPMGDLLLQTAVLGAYEKLSSAETLAAITVRAAHALRLSDIGILDISKRADIIAFPCKSYKDILYYQGSMKPAKVWVSK